MSSHVTNDGLFLNSEHDFATVSYWVVLLLSAVISSVNRHCLSSKNPLHVLAPIWVSPLCYMYRLFSNKYVFSTGPFPNYSTFIGFLPSAALLPNLFFCSLVLRAVREILTVWECIPK